MTDTIVWDDEEEEREESGGVFEPEAGMAVWVMAAKCATCIFRPGNLMYLEEGRVKEMVEASVENEAHIVCHDTLLYGHDSRLRPAVCRGYHDHPLGNERSVALRAGRSLRSFQYQAPVRKAPNTLLAERVAAAGLSMRIVPGAVQRHSTGWTSREWEVTYLLDGRTFRTTVRMGMPEVEPTLVECLQSSLEAARVAYAVDTYEEWGTALGGPDPRTWPQEHLYEEHVRHTVGLAVFFDGELREWLDAHGAPGHGGQCPGGDGG